jgi:uncharacterized NAD(P)/FAD-binding protein YdhS
MSTVEYVEAIDTALDGIEGMTANLRALADAGSKMGDGLTSNIDLITREERFEEAMKMWRQFSRMAVRSRGLSYTSAPPAATPTRCSASYRKAMNHE